MRGLKQSIMEKEIEKYKSHPTWVRGLKLVSIRVFDRGAKVAPYVGAWIETGINKAAKKMNKMSHPTWVRGLKLNIKPVSIGVARSHPTWVRGLKLFSWSNIVSSCGVAPYVGAWIET